MDAVYTALGCAFRRTRALPPAPRGVGSYTRNLVYGVGHGKPGKSGGLW
jgi:hypothetical protein